MNRMANEAYASVDISDADVMEAMKAMQGYIDITPADFREVYQVAYGLARDRVMKGLKAGQIMRTPVHVIETGQGLVEAAALLAREGISGAPVVDRDGRVVGVVSEKDFLRKMGAEPGGSFMQVIALCLQNKGCVAAPMLKRTAGEIMTSPAVTATVDISMADISALLSEKGINRLPIVGGDGRPVGIVTRSDLIEAFCRIE